MNTRLVSPLLAAGLYLLAPALARGQVSLPVRVVNTPTVNAQQAGPWAVSVSAPASAPLAVTFSGTPLVKSAGDDASRTPWQVGVRGSIIPGGCVDFYPVPAGQRFVIEHVAGVVTTFAGQLPTLSLKTSSASYDIWLPATKVGPFDTSYDLYQVSVPLRAYVDAGSASVCSTTPFSASTGNNMSGDVVLVGYLVTL